MIGENQKNVFPAAKRIGGVRTFTDFFPPQLQGNPANLSQELFNATLEFNKHLIRRLDQTGYRFLVIGIDQSRSSRSPFYQAELEVLNELGRRAGRIRF